jgi:adenylate cyclase
MPSLVYAELVPVGGGDAIPLMNTPMTVGRRRSNNICLDYANVSGSHCEFSCDDGIWFVRDLGSQNGVKVNGEKILTRKALKPSDKVTIAKSHLYSIEYKLTAEAKAKLDELAGQEDDIYSMSLMEKAGLERKAGGPR